MAQCTNGSQVAAGSPAYFEFSDSDLLTFATPVVGFVSQAMMGLPFGPQSTTTFCAIEPTGDLPTAPDYALLAFPPAAFIAGAYGRFGNQVKQDRFGQLCVCSSPGSGGSSAPCTIRGPFVINATD